MDDTPKPDARSVGVSHRGSGKVTDLDLARSRVELDHGPIPSMKWPAMKMGFAVREKSELARLKKGDTVEFEVRGDADKEGNYVIERITPTLTGSKP
jgi:Cu/Ag efflux protein CusF